VSKEKGTVFFVLHGEPDSVNDEKYASLSKPASFLSPTMRNPGQPRQELIRPPFPHPGATPFFFSPYLEHCTKRYCGDEGPHTLSIRSSCCPESVPSCLPPTRTHPPTPCLTDPSPAWGTIFPPFGYFDFPTLESAFLFTACKEIMRIRTSTVTVSSPIPTPPFHLSTLKRVVPRMRALTPNRFSLNILFPPWGSPTNSKPFVFPARPFHFSLRWHRVRCGTNFPFFGQEFFSPQKATKPTQKIILITLTDAAPLFRPTLCLHRNVILT